jgi:hypothetical protein
MIKNFLSLMLIIIFIAGCTSKEEYIAYYKTIQAIEATRATERRVARAEFIEAIKAVKDSPMSVLAITLSGNSYRVERPASTLLSVPSTTAENITAVGSVLLPIVPWVAMSISTINIADKIAGTYWEDNSTHLINSFNPETISRL